jgi:RNA polymerase sigma factor (sigma-70 family)
VGGLAGRAVGLVVRAAPPDEQLAERETLQALEAAFGQLPEHYRRVIRLRTQEDRPYEEIASMLAITADAAQERWTRAVARLGHEMNDR